jgi:DUF1365 family protein
MSLLARILPMALDAGDALAGRFPVPAATRQSALYVGWVRHRRHSPVAHAFRQKLFMLYVDLDELETVFKRRWFWSVGRRNLAEFRRSDFLGDPAVPLERAVRDCVQQQTGQRPTGPIRLLAHLRYFGHSFNPVSFYYCYAADGKQLQAIVAEITNTPWKQRHRYVLPVSSATRHGGALHWRFDKAFHVSPFMAMAHEYHWCFTPPDDALRVHMQVLDPHADAATGAGCAFDATLVLHRRPCDGRHLARALLRFPLMTLQVVVGIHWQALRLWMRGNPVHDHPDKRTSPP